MSMIDTWAFLQLLKEDRKPSPEAKNAETSKDTYPETQPEVHQTMREMLEPGETGRMFFCLFKVLGTIALIPGSLFLIHAYGILSFLVGLLILILVSPILILLVSGIVVLVCDLILSFSK